MNKFIIPIGLASGWIFSLVFCTKLWVDNQNLRKTAIEKAAVSKVDDVPKRISSNPSWDIFGLEDMNFFRDQGKIDGKVEAILLMANLDSSANLNEEQTERIISLAEKAPNKDVNGEFLSLLCRAAYHKGISVGSENEKQDDSYERGYHKAIEDFTCPETGKVDVPPKKDLDMKKP